jgi:hypothetical protein
MFVWCPHLCEGGDWGAIAAKARASGFSWLILHEYMSATVTSALQAAGFWVGYSFYSVPGEVETAHQIDQAKRALDAGVNGICVDAEEFWERLPDGRPGWRGTEAEHFALKLRTAIGDTWLANDGAWQWPRSHPQYPDVEFAQWVDAAMPERYWTEFSPHVSYDKAIRESELQWATYPDVLRYRSTIPIGSCYGINGELPAGHQPLALPDLENFMGRYATAALWDWMHCPKVAWELLARRANLVV